MAAEITKNGENEQSVRLYAPYEKTRNEVRSMIEEVGGFVEIYVNTPLEECEKRDRKGLYAQARAGKIKGFTGIDDPYEVPINPEIEINTLDPFPGTCSTPNFCKNIGRTGLYKVITY